jgi:hypothetical protein
MSTKAPECWSSDPNARAVKIEVSAELSLLLPFDQFAFAELKSEGKEQRLHLVFATHEVTLHGHCLRRIETGMQRMELSFLMARALAEAGGSEEERKTQAVFASGSVASLTRSPPA